MSTTSASEFTAYFDMTGKLVLQVRPTVATLSVPMSITRAPQRAKPIRFALALLIATILFLGLVIAGLEYSYAIKPVHFDGPPTTYRGVAVDYD